ncbi:response regulator [Salinispirillum marinum]|uniref:Response regulator n=2 Tax=Saccharospirillaceae TaxID=255527 RepID=A0ABV8BEQ2_9GAMM
MATVLIVDDHALTVEFIAEQLHMMGHRSHSVATGEAALALLGAGDQPDAILLSQNIPAQGGIVTAQRMRERHQYEHAIIALAAHADDIDIPAGIAAGIDAWITHPIDITQFVSTLQRWLS